MVITYPPPLELAQVSQSRTAVPSGAPYCAALRCRSERSRNAEAMSRAEPRRCPERSRGIEHSALLHYFISLFACRRTQPRFRNQLTAFCVSRRAIHCRKMLKVSLRLSHCFLCGGYSEIAGISTGAAFGMCSHSRMRPRKSSPNV